MLFLSIDGVAPRAKLNQQRCRRFTSALEREQKLKIQNELKSKWEKNQLGEVVIKAEEFDSNAITPGTDFMESLSDAIKQFLFERSQTNPLYKNLAIVFSDSNLKGEGEHKILDFIRGLRSINLNRK